MRRVIVALALASLVAGAEAGAAQDVEVLSAVHGVPLPQGYWDRISWNPDFFELPTVWRGKGAAGVEGASAAVEGSFPLLVIPALFADSDEPIFSREEVQRVLFDGPAVDGTIVEFYEAASRGAFTIDGTVSPWVRTSLTVSEVVAASFGLGDDSRTGDYLAEAVGLADEFVDYRMFDNDGPDGVPNSGDDDGVVDALTFEFQEVSASCNGPAIWPHRSALAFWTGGPVPTNDIGASGEPIVANGYLIQSATDCTGQNIQNAGVISHEFGHALGLPDIYHPIDGLQPAQRRWVLGCWALMAAGSWGCGDGSTRGSVFGPTSMSPWSKNRLGWAALIEVPNAFNEEFVLNPATESGEALLVPLDAVGNEFFLIEYRPRVGFDVFLPSEGVLVYHWDRAGQLRPARGSGNHYRISLVEADGRADLKFTHGNGGNRGEASDAWAVGGVGGPIHSESVPNSRRNAGDLASTVSVHSITVDGDVARIRLTNTPTPGLLDPGALPDGGLFNPFDGRLEIAGGVPPYAATLVGDARGMLVSTEGRHLVVRGAPEEQGILEVAAEIRDSTGGSGLVFFPVTVGEFMMTTPRAVTAFIVNGEIPLNDGERQILDSRGNADGTYDIGDLRAFLYDRP